MMENHNSGGTKALETLTSKVSQWRAGCGTKRARVPEDLWEEAVVVARTSGVFATAKATRLHYSVLKKRVEQAKQAPASERPSPTFIEVAPPAVEWSQPPLPSESESKTVVEFEGRDGGRLRVEVTGKSAVDLVGLAREFWGSTR